MIAYKIHSAYILSKHNAANHYFAGCKICKNLLKINGVYRREKMEKQRIHVRQQVHKKEKNKTQCMQICLYCSAYQQFYHHHHHNTLHFPTCTFPAILGRCSLCIFVYGTSCSLPNGEQHKEFVMSNKVNIYTALYIICMSTQNRICLTTRNKYSQQ